jgi:hypothetical protein
VQLGGELAVRGGVFVELGQLPVDRVVCEQIVGTRDLLGDQMDRVGNDRQFIGKPFGLGLAVFETPEPTFAQLETFRIDVGIRSARVANTLELGTIRHLRSAQRSLMGDCQCDMSIEQPFQIGPLCEIGVASLDVIYQLCELNKRMVPDARRWKLLFARIASSISSASDSMRGQGRS